MHQEGVILVAPTGLQRLSGTGVDAGCPRASPQEGGRVKICWQSSPSSVLCQSVLARPSEA